MKKLSKEQAESLEADCLKICEAFKRLYGLENVVFLTRIGDTLGTFSDSSDAETVAIIRVADRYHNEGMHWINNDQDN
jgi:hypothetical protein